VGASGREEVVVSREEPRISPIFDLALRGRGDQSPADLASNEVLLHVVHDVGGQPDVPLDLTEHKEEPWETRTHATCECLCWRGHWSAEERRRGENDLGQTLYAGIPYYGRWALVAAKHLLDTGKITPDELSAKMEAVRARYEASQAEATP
jgi:hypothetical protein